MKDPMELIIEFEHTMFRQLRTLGVQLQDDAGNRIKPGSPEEIRVLRLLARSCVRSLLPQEECQTPDAGSNS